MKQKYFISGVHYTSSNSAMERYLAQLAEAAVDCIFDRKALESFADDLRKLQDMRYSLNKRLTPVEISLHFKTDDRYSMPTGMGIGTVSVTIRDVKGENYLEVEA